MKFVELKSKLDRETRPVYIIQGEDRFVCLNAESLFEKRFAVNYPDINRIVMDENCTMQSIVNNAMVFPLGDEYRLIEVRDFKPQNEKQDTKLLEEYLKNPSDQTVIIFINSKESTFFGNLAKKVELVDCSRLEEKWLAAWIKQNASKENVTIGDDTIRELIMLSDGYLTKISTELAKLASFVGNGGTITPEIVDNLVEKSKEYKVYELSEKVARRDTKMVFEILNNMLESDNNPVVLLSVIYKHFSRLFMIAVSNKTNDELASIFSVNPYAVTKMRSQCNEFNAKNLRKIVSMLEELDYKIKSGKINQDSAIVCAICNIINTR